MIAEDLRKNGVFWVVTPCGSCKNQRFGGTWRLLHQGDKNRCVVPSSPIFVTLMKEAPGSPETSVLTRVTWRNNPEDTILHSHRRESLKSYDLRKVCHSSQNSSFGIASRYERSGPLVKNIHISVASRPALGSTHCHQCIRKSLSSRVNQLGCQAHHSPQTCAEIKQTRIYTSTLAYSFVP
jgi:hypothetical protein